MCSKLDDQFNSVINDLIIGNHCWSFEDGILVTQSLYESKHDLSCFIVSLM